MPLDGSGTTDDQTFTVTMDSGNPDITASIPQQNFWTIDVQYTDPSNQNNDFTGPLTFQLFQTLTPNTVSEIEKFTTDGFYSAAGDPNNGNKNGISIPGSRRASTV